jgi:hypothetical protein
MSDIILRFPTSVTFQGGEQIQADWTQADTEALDFIKNKPANLVQDADYNHTDNNLTDEIIEQVDVNTPLINQTYAGVFNLSTNREVYYDEHPLNEAHTPNISATPIVPAGARVVFNAGASASLVTTNIGAPLPESDTFIASQLNEVIVYSLPEGIRHIVTVL